MRSTMLRFPPLLLGVVVAACGCSGMRSGDETLASNIYQQKRLDQLDASEVRPVQFEEPADDAGLQVEKLPGKLTEEIKKATGRASDPEEARTLFREAESEFRQASQMQGSGRASAFRKAAAKYEAAAKKWPDSALEEDAMFMVGDCYFFADEYPEANEAFEKLLDRYPHSRHLDRAESRRFSIAQYWLEKHRQQNLSALSVNMMDKTRPLYDSFGHALRVFDRIRLDDPTGKLADDATLAAGNAHFAAGKFIQADEFFTDLRRAYPNSEHQFAAHLLSVKAKLESYQGPEYSGDALDKAEELITQIQKQFPVEARKEKEFLQRAYAEVRHLQAEREWWMARYFDRRAEYRAARMHYQRIVDEYPETAFLADARQRLQAVSDRPDKPPERLSWLIKMFPREEQVKPLFDSGGGPTIRR